jgi:hypothetical protein
MRANLELSRWVNSLYTWSFEGDWPIPKSILDAGCSILDERQRSDHADLQLSSIQHRVSSIEYPASSIQHQASSIQYQASSIQHRASSIQHPASSIQHPASSI